MATTATGRAPVSLPSELEELIDRRIDQMSASELRDFEKKAEQIMNESKRRSGERRPVR